MPTRRIEETPDWVTSYYPRKRRRWLKSKLRKAKLWIVVGFLFGGFFGCLAVNLWLL